MVTPLKRRSPAKSPTHKSVSQELYEKERTKADDFIAFMTSPSPSKSVTSKSSNVSTKSPYKRFANKPFRTYSTRHESPSQTNQNTNTKDDVLPFLTTEETPSKPTPLWTDLEVAKSPAQMESERKTRMKRRGISPNSHGRALARSLSTPNTAKLMADGHTLLSPGKRSSAEVALLYAQKRRGGSHSPRGRFHKSSVLSGGDGNVTNNSSDNGVAVDTHEDTTDTNTSTITTVRGRKRCPPKFYHDELVDIKDRESPSRFDSPRFGLLPDTKKEMDSTTSKATTVETKSVEKSIGANRAAVSDAAAIAAANKTIGKKRRKSRARRQVSVGFSLGNIGDSESNTPAVSSNHQSLDDSDNSDSKKQRNIKTKQVLSNKEIEEMMMKKRRQSIERKKKATARKEAAKTAAAQRLEDAEVAVQRLEDTTLKQIGNTVPMGKGNAPPEMQQNLILQLLLDSPSSVDKTSDGKKTDELQSSKSDKPASKIAVTKQSSTDKEIALPEKSLNKSASSSSDSSNQNQASNASPSTKESSPSPSRRAKSQATSSLEKVQKTTVESLDSPSSVDKTSDGKKTDELQSSQSDKPASKIADTKQSSIDKEIASPEKSLNKSASSSSDLSNQNQASNASPSTKESSPSPSRRAKSQATSSLEKVQKTTVESPGRRAKRQAASSLESVPSPESPLRAKRLLAALHDDNSAPTEEISPFKPVESIAIEIDGRVSSASENKNQTLPETNTENADLPNTDEMQNAVDPKDNDEEQPNKRTSEFSDVTTMNSPVCNKNDVALESFDSVSQSPADLSVAMQDQAAANVAPRVQLGHTSPNSQALVAQNHHQSTVNQMQMSDQKQFQQMMLADERLYQDRLEEFNQMNLDLRHNNERLKALQEKIIGIQAKAASLGATESFFSPVHYESVSRTYHSEIISSKRRRYRPNEYGEHRHSSRRRSNSRDERRLSGSKRDPRRQSKRKGKSRRYDGDSTDESELEFRRRKKERRRTRKEDFSSSESELEKPLRMSRNKRDKERNRSKRIRKHNDESSADEQRSMSKKENRRTKRREESTDDSELEYHQRSNAPRKRQAESVVGSPTKESVSPRRAKTRHTNSVLESVSPLRKRQSRVASPKRAKLSQSSVLEGVGSDSDTQNDTSPAKPPNEKELSHNSPTNAVEPSSNTPTKNEPNGVTKPEVRDGGSFWLLSGDDSESDWDFDGPMILPPPPI